MYLVVIDDAGGLGKTTVGVRETSMPAHKAGLRPGAYRWQVQPVDDNLRSVGVDPSPWWTFTAR
jgi:hypothetical protein